MSSTSFNQTTLAIELSKTVNALRNSLAIANIQVPKFDEGIGIYEFIANYENITSTLDDELKVALISKSFPPGTLTAWYRTELEPLIKASSSWFSIKEKLIERFSKAKDNDRHLARLKNLTFSPESDKKLLNYIEEMVYAFTMAFKKTNPIQDLIRFIKAGLPDKTQSYLSTIHEWREAKSIDDLKEAARTYDALIKSRTTSVMDQNVNNLSKTLLDLIEDIKRDREDIRADVLALKTAPCSNSTSSEALPRANKRGHH